MSLTLSEWRSLSEDERRERYHELSKHDMFLERVGEPEEDGSVCPKHLQEYLESSLDEWYKEQMKIKRNM